MVSAPRRFGKTVNLDMIKTFSEVTVDEEGNRINREETDNYKIFAENNLNILQDRLFFNNHFGKYPVIYLDFKQLTCTSYKEFLNDFRLMLLAVFDNHDYLLSSSVLNKRQIKRLDDYNNKLSDAKMLITELRRSVLFLSKLLYQHFNKTKCIVLIDEYDGPIQKSVFKLSTEVDLILDFICEFISFTLKSNTYVERALINACVILGSITTDANNIQYIPFLEDSKFYKFYGFTEEEVLLLLKKLKMSDMLNKIHEWYDGYTVGNSNITIYNPFSIVNCLESKKFQNYWMKSSDVKNLENIFLDKIVSRRIDQLLDESSSIIAKNKMNIENIVKLKEIVNSKCLGELSESDADLFIQFMIYLGYFNIVYRGEKMIVIKIPNLEIKKEIKSALYSGLFLKDKLNTNTKNINFYVHSLLELGKNNASFLSFAVSVGNLHANLPRMPDNEIHFQHALCAFPAFSTKFLLVESEISTERGKRLDLLIIRKDSVAIIIEVKYNGSSAYEALKQIINYRYFDVLNEKYKFLKIKGFILVGLCVNKNKRCDLCYTVNSINIKMAQTQTANHI